MSMSQKLSAAMEKIITKGGTPIRVQYFTYVYDDVYDDSVTLFQSGADLWTSGVVLPISQSNATDSISLEQGKITLDDKKLFLHGSLALTGSEMSISIRIGSPSNEIDKQYTMLSQTHKAEVSNVPIYKQVFIREIGGIGSLMGLELN